LRVNFNLRRDFKVIWVVQSPRKKYSAGPVGQITFTTPPVSPEQGRIAIVTNAGWDVVDAAASARKVIAGRVSREQSTGAQTNDAKAYGKSVWFRHPLLVSSCRWRSRSDRIDQPSSRQRR
jgi:hypothetical protein